jgi:hypothetical protein
MVITIADSRRLFPSVTEHQAARVGEEVNANFSIPGRLAFGI